MPLGDRAEEAQKGIALPRGALPHQGKQIRVGFLQGSGLPAANASAGPLHHCRADNETKPTP